MPRRLKNRPEIPILILILLVGAFFRLDHLGSRPLYWDEPWYTVAPAVQPLSELVRTNLGSIAYPILVHFLLPLGDPEVTSRLPAALFGIMSIAAIYWVGKLLFGKTEALLAALLAALSTYQIYFSQQARAYTALLFFSILAIGFLWQALKESRMILWVGYILTLVVGAYFHFFLLVVIPVHAAFVIFSGLERWIEKKFQPESRFQWKQFGLFLASILIILTATYLLHLPTKDDPNAVMLSEQMAFSVKGFLRGNPGIYLFDFAADTIKRLLDYQVWPRLFYYKLLIICLGMIGCLKAERRQLALFLLFIVLPFVLFVFSNPIDVYKTAQDNKFIFLTPVFMLLMAKAITSAGNILARGLAKIFRLKRKAFFRSAALGLVVTLILAGEVVYLQEHIFFSRMKSFDISPAARSYIARHVEALEPIFSGHPFGKINPVLANLLKLGPEGRTRVMLIEEEWPDLMPHLSRPGGAWMIYRRTLFDADDISRIKSTFPGIDVEECSDEVLVHYRNPELTLAEKIVHLLDIYCSLSLSEENRYESYLLLTAVELFMGHYYEAMRHLDAASAIYSPASRGKFPAEDEAFFKQFGQKLLPYPVEYRHRLAQEALRARVNELLISSAEKSLFATETDEAFALLNRVMQPQAMSEWARLSYFFVLGGAWKQKGEKRAALDSYRQALLLVDNREQETILIREIAALHGLSSAYLIWQAAGTCNIRWWSDQEGDFSGRISCPQKFKHVDRVRPSPSDAYGMSQDVILFRASTQEGTIRGLTISTAEPAQLTFDLRIDGRRSNVRKRVIIFPDKDNPAGIYLLK